MKKKSYMTPDIEVIKIQMATVIATSPGAGVDPTESADPGDLDAREFDW